MFGDGDSDGHWTADGRYYVFESAHEAQPSLWVIREERTLFHRAKSKPVLLSPIPFLISGLSVGRDAKRIFFVGTQERRELVRYDAKSQEFVPFLSGIPARWVSFSRDGQWVAYAAVPAPAPDELWRGRADGTDQLQLTFPPMYVYTPRWSPDGKRIAFCGDLRGEGKVYVISADGSGLEALAEGGDPNWSRDGEMLVFDKNEPIGTPQERWSVWLLNLKTRPETPARI